MTGSTIGDETVLVRPAWAKLHHCKVRNRWLLLVPERVLYPCPTTVELLQRLARPTRFASVVDEFAASYDAPAEVVGPDLAELLLGLLEKGYVQRAAVS